MKTYKCPILNTQNNHTAFHVCVTNGEVLISLLIKHGEELHSHCLMKGKDGDRKHVQGALSNLVQITAW